MVPWSHPNLPSNWHLDQFGHFCRAHERDQQTTWPTNRHTDHASSVCSNRSHLCTECILCGVMNKLITLKFVAKTPNSPHFRCKSTIRCGWNIGVRRKENASDRVHRRYESSSPETNRRLRCCERLPVAACSESTCLYQDYSSRRSTQ